MFGPGRWLPLVGVLATLAAIAACNGTGATAGGDDDDDDDAATSFPPGSVTYYEDVLPVVMENCQSCHTAGGLATAIDQYPIAQSFANTMAQRTGAREMPPWPPDPACDAPLKNERLLSANDKALFAAWAADGAPEGNPANAPTPTPAPAATPAPDLVLDHGMDFVYDGAQQDLYMCFPVEPDTDLDFVRAKIYPGNTAAVHHVILYRDVGGADGNLDPYECGGPGGADFLIGWSPGAAGLAFEDGIGMQIAADDKLIIQVHYHATGVEEIDRTTVGLWAGTVNEVARVVWSGGPFSQIPNPPTVTGACTIPNNAGDVTLLGMAPHMHTTGTEFTVDLESGEDRCLMDIPKWNFEWQGGYFYQQPFTLGGGDRITLSCSWQQESVGIPFGEGTEDEMCLLFLYMIAGPNMPRYCLF